MTRSIYGPSKQTVSTFVSQSNPITGMIQWTNVDDDYDFEQETAQSAYADMLHDHDRNRRYYQALRHVIQKMKTSGRDVHVLDIGCGTGLLSMMAARVGADSVVACEAFAPVATCAQRILEANGLKDRVKLVHKHSTDLVIGEDMVRKANVLVAELFDTELIGEGVLKTYRHAIDNLLTSDAVLIPCKAKMYMQIVESPFLWSHNRIERFEGGFCFPTEDMLHCHGSPVVFDLQASRLQFTHDESIIMDKGSRAIRCLLEKPLMFHEFKFAPPSSNLKLEEAKRIREIDGEPITACCDGTVHAVVVWWELHMEPSDHIPPISTAPQNTEICGISGDPRVTPTWREHWMQAVYFPPHCPLTVSAGQALLVDFVHDDFSMRFDVCIASNPHIDQLQIFCHCLTHLAWPRFRFAQLNRLDFRRDTFNLAKSIIDQVSALRSPSVALVVVTDATFLPLQLHNLLSSESTTIFHLDTSPMSLKIMEPVYRSACANIKLEENMDDLLVSLENFVANSSTPVEICVVSEPFFTTALLPWNSLHFWYVYAEIKQRLPHTSCQLLTPTCLRVWAVAMEFEHLWKIRSPVGADCEGFDLRLFDDMISAAAAKTDAPVEPHPLWEYAGKARSEAHLAFEMCLNDPPALITDPGVPNSSSKQTAQTHILPLSTTTTLEGSASINAVALWAEWRVADGTWRSVGGPIEPVQLNQEVEWCNTGPHSGVFFINSHLKEQVKLQKHVCALKVESDFDFYAGEPIFRFSLV